MPPGPPGTCVPGPGAAEALGAAGGATGAEYTGRGPVCGIITRRGAAVCGWFRARPSVAWPAIGSEICGCVASALGAELTAVGAGVDSAFTTCETPAAATGVSGAVGLTNTGAPLTGVAGRTSPCGCAAAPWTGGFAITGPVGGLAAIAGTEGGGAITMRGSCRGCGTIFRGAGGAASTADRCAGAGGVAGAAGVGAAGGAAAATGRGLGDAASSLRRRISRIASPGFDTCDQSIFGFCPLPPERCCASEAARLPRCRYARTRSASSLSRELEWVFFSVTPTAVKVSRISRLLTSSSRARSLIRTLLIRLFNAPSQGA
jgi:hypothetical protein